jgi:RNA polymerase sigma-70 factor (ECF subfamily)
VKDLKSVSPTDSIVPDSARLIEQHQAGIWRYLRVLGCDAAQADDLTQETFLLVMQRPFHDHCVAATAAYLRTTAHNLFVSAQRRAGRMRPTDNVEDLDQTWTNWAGSDNGEALLEALRDCLTQLTERARFALEMRFEKRLTREEIATELGITEHGTKNLMQRAKQQLRRCIEGKLG